MHFLMWLIGLKFKRIWMPQNKLKRYLFAGLFLLSTCLVSARNQQVDFFFLDQAQTNFKAIPFDSLEMELETFVPKHQKFKAIMLAVFLGHFGVHRIYLGTSPNVPVVYSLTLGGGLGLLPLLDIVAIASTKNLDEFKNSDRVFMWQDARPTQP